MSAAPKVFRSPVLDYTAAGFKLCLVKPNSKEATGNGWNFQPLPTEFVLPDGYGLGLLLNHSGLVSFDIDDLDLTRQLFADAGIDVDQLLNDPANVHILSGKEGRDKLLFRKPVGETLTTCKVTHKVEGVRRMAYELRCADSNGGSVQDVLPVATHCHPDTGKPYRWQGDYLALPTLPASILTHWKGLLEALPKGNGSDKPTVCDIPLEEASKMLDYLDPNCPREAWRDAGMILKLHYGDDGFPAWNAWSAKATGKGSDGKDLYPGERAMWKQWQSFKTEGENLKRMGSLVNVATAAGYRFPQPQLPPGMFGPVPQQSPAQQSPDGEPLREWGGQPWGEPHDIRASVEQLAPEYTTGMLPEVYERMMAAQVAFWPNANMGYYAGSFGAAVAQHLPSHICVEIRAGSNKFTSIANYTGLLGNTGSGKDKVMNAALGVDEDGPLLNWNADTYKKYDMPPDSKGRKSFTPKILHRKFSVEAMRAQIDINHNTARVPANITTPEMYDALEGGSAHNQSAFESINSFYCARWDGGYDSSMSFSHGNSHSDGGVLNMMFCTVPNGLANWRFLPDAMRSGLIARMDLFTNTQPLPDWCKTDKLDMVPVRLWAAVQAKLHTLTPLKLYLAPCEVQGEVDRLVKMGNRLTDQGAAHAAWLNKLEVKLARLSAAIMLVEMQVEPAKYPVEDAAFGKKAIVPASCQHKAWEYLTKFAWPHQCFIHNEVLAGEEMKEALMHFARQLYLKKKTRYQADELTGSKALLTRVRSWPDPMKDKLLQLMIGYDWISPSISSHRVFPMDKPYKSGAFEVNPKFFDAFAKYTEEMIEEKAILMGGIDGRIKPGKH